jgi:hypothetical protein
MCLCVFFVDVSVCVFLGAVPKTVCEGSRGFIGSCVMSDRGRLASAVFALPAVKKVVVTLFP